MKISPFTKKFIIWSSAYTIAVRLLTMYVANLESEIIINLNAPTAQQTSVERHTTTNFFKI